MYIKVRVLQRQRPVFLRAFYAHEGTDLLDSATRRSKRTGSCSGMKWTAGLRTSILSVSGWPHGCLGRCPRKSQVLWPAVSSSLLTSHLVHIWRAPRVRRLGTSMPISMPTGIRSRFGSYFCFRFCLHRKSGSKAAEIIAEGSSVSW